MTKLKKIHSKEVFLEEFLIPLNITTLELAKDLNIPQTGILQIFKRKTKNYRWHSLTGK